MDFNTYDWLRELFAMQEADLVTIVEKVSDLQSKSSNYGDQVTDLWGKEVEQWMKSSKDDYYDPNTGEINCTRLTEAAMDHFGVPDDDDDTFDWFSSIAVDVAG